MHRVYTAESLVQVAHLRNVLEPAGIRCVLRNDRLAGVLGEIPFVECWPELWVETPGEERRARALIAEALRKGPGKVYVFAKRVMVESCLRVLDPGGTARKEELHALFDQVSKIIAHQANARIIKGAAKDLEARLDIPEESVDKKMMVTIEKYGNNSTASIPLALDESRRNGKLKKDDLLILVGFAAGLTYGANLVRL